MDLNNLNQELGDLGGMMEGKVRDTIKKVAKEKGGEYIKDATHKIKDIANKKGVGGLADSAINMAEKGLGMDLDGDLDIGK